MKQARLTDDDWTASAAESQSASAQSDEDEKSGESTPAMKAALCARVATHAGEIAAEHFPGVTCRSDRLGDLDADAALSRRRDRRPSE